MDTLKPSEIASLLTAFVCQDRNNRNEEQINKLNLESWISDKFVLISFELQGAMIATYDLISKITDEEGINILDQSKIVSDIRRCIR